jgi:hypothetical protein
MSRAAGNPVARLLKAQRFEIFRRSGSRIGDDAHPRRGSPGLRARLAGITQLTALNISKHSID